MTAHRKLLGLSITVFLALGSLEIQAQENLPATPTSDISPGEILSTLSGALKQVSALNPLSAAKAPGRAAGADVEKFDIAGVRLGMSKEEAFAAITRKYSIPKSAIKPSGFPSYNEVTGAKEQLNFSVEEGGATIGIQFMPRLPADADRPLVVSLVSYKLPASQTNDRALFQSAVEKYGPPTAGTSWCLHPTSSAIGGCPSADPILEFSVGGMVLRNPAYNKAVFEYAMRKRDVKPKF